MGLLWDLELALSCLWRVPNLSRKVLAYFRSWLGPLFFKYLVESNLQLALGRFYPILHKVDCICSTSETGYKIAGCFSAGEVFMKKQLNKQKKKKLKQQEQKALGWGKFDCHTPTCYFSLYSNTQYKQVCSSLGHYFALPDDMYFLVLIVESLICHLLVIFRIERYASRTDFSSYTSCGGCVKAYSICRSLLCIFIATYIF